MDIHVNANGYERWDAPVEVQLDPDRPIARVIEVGAGGTVLDPAVPFQHDADGALLFLLTGATPAGATRRFRIEFGTEARPVTPLVTLVEAWSGTRLSELHDGASGKGQGGDSRE